ncbi:nucleotidyltransferase domain-containing protein [bacterium]|nr:nucleotidyltransferase domain-containing protein [bacterium]
MAKQYAAVVSRCFSVKKILLYGSYARGNYHEHSDIDIALVVLSSKLFALSFDINREV